MSARGSRRPSQPSAAQDAEKTEPTTTVDSGDPGDETANVDTAGAEQAAPGTDEAPVQSDAVTEAPKPDEDTATGEQDSTDAAPDEPAEPAETERTLTPSGDTDELDQVEAELAALKSDEPVPGESLVEIDKLGTPSPTGTLLPNQVENTVGVAPSQVLAEASASPEGTAAKRAGLDDWPDGVEFVTRHSSLIVYGASSPVFFTDGRAVVDDTEQLDAVAAVADEFDIKVAVPVRFILQAMDDDQDDDSTDES